MCTSEATGGTWLLLRRSPSVSRRPSISSKESCSTPATISICAAPITKQSALEIFMPASSSLCTSSSVVRSISSSSQARSMLRGYFRQTRIERSHRNREFHPKRPRTTVATFAFTRDYWRALVGQVINKNNELSQLKIRVSAVRFCPCHHLHGAMGHSSGWPFAFWGHPFAGVRVCRHKRPIVMPRRSH